MDSETHMNMIDVDKIYNEDCIVGMKRIPDNAVDCIICDLPYGTTRNPWDSVLPLDQLWKEYKRIIKARGAIVLTCQMPFTAVLASSNLEMLKYEWIWEKSNPTGHLNANFAPMKTHENVLVFSKSAACFVKDRNDAMVYNPQYRQGKAYRCTNGTTSKNYDTSHQKQTETIQDGNHYRPLDIIKISSEKDTIHPTQKPVDLMRYLVLTYSNEGDLILDNCIGSGTTAIACIKEKRHFIGFELNKEYYEKACERIRKEQQQLNLF